MPERSPLQESCAQIEPPDVAAARALLKRWQLRNGHSSYVAPLNGGWDGYQARCWDCDWKGPEYLRGDEDMATAERRAHKTNARHDAVSHQDETKPTDWREWTP